MFASPRLASLLCASPSDRLAATARRFGCDCSLCFLLDWSRRCRRLEWSGEREGSSDGCCCSCCDRLASRARRTDRTAKGPAIRLDQGTADGRARPAQPCTRLSLRGVMGYSRPLECVVASWCASSHAHDLLLVACWPGWPSSCRRADSFDSTPLSPFLAPPHSRITRVHNNRSDCGGLIHWCCAHRAIDGR